MGGWPKKDGVFKWEETEEGVTVEVSRYGHVLARTKASFQASDVDARKWPEEFNVPEYGSCNLQVRHLAKTVADEPELAEVVKTDYPNFESSVSIAIDSTFELSNGPLDEFNILGDIDILSARYEKSSFDFDISRSIGVHKLR